MAEHSIEIVTEDDGSQWVELHHYTAMQQRAMNYAAVVEQFQKLLGAFTTTSAFEAIKRNKRREKYWQEKAGRMATVANFMYENVDESTLSSNGVDQVHDMFKEIMDFIDFDEGDKHE